MIETFIKIAKNIGLQARTNATIKGDGIVYPFKNDRNVYFLISKCGEVEVASNGEKGFDIHFQYVSEYLKKECCHIAIKFDSLSQLETAFKQFVKNSKDKDIFWYVVRLSGRHKYFAYGVKRTPRIKIDYNARTIKYFVQYEVERTF